MVVEIRNRILKGGNRRGCGKSCFLKLSFAKIRDKMYITFANEGGGNSESGE
jgi:hypothetical protein